MRISILHLLLLFICLTHVSSLHCSNTSFQSDSSKTLRKQDKDFGWLSTYLDQFHQQRGFSGAVLVAQHGRIIFDQIIGWQDVEKKLLNNSETRFNLGSGNKMFTSVAIAQLVEAGKLRYEDPLILHLPDYPDQDFAKKATVADLLRHSSGLGDYWTDEYEQHWHRLTKLEERLPFVVKQPIQFEPGEQYSYSNSGFILLGLIIEKVSKQSYFDYIRAHIYQPAGMSHSDSYQNDGSMKNLATAYEGLGHQWYPARHGLMGTSAGGGFSTIYDMLKFDLALRSNKLVGAGYVQQMRTDQTALGQKDLWQYGYGFIVGQDNGQPRIGHGGRAPGIFFEYYFYPENAYTLIIFSNAEGGAPQSLFNKISHFITDSTQQQIALPDQTDLADGNDFFQVDLVEPPDLDNFIQTMTSEEASKKAHWSLIAELATAINRADADGFNKHFAKQDLVTLASNESMFNFMIQDVLPIRGKIKEFHAMGDLVTIPGSDFPIQVGTFHLEDGYPGSISISMDEKGKIDHISLFVHPQICPHGPNSSCPKVSLKLEE